MLVTNTLRALVVFAGIACAAPSLAGCAVDTAPGDPEATASGASAITKGPAPVMEPHSYDGYIVTCGGGACSCDTSQSCSDLGKSGVCSDAIQYYNGVGYCHTDLFR